MKIIEKPVDENILLSPLQKDATTGEVLKSFTEKAECCVNHLCGCS